MDKEFDSLVDLLRETDTPVGKMYGVVPKQNIEKARKKFKMIVAQETKKAEVRGRIDEVDNWKDWLKHSEIEVVVDIVKAMVERKAELQAQSGESK